MTETIARGLKDVVLDTTESSFIDGEIGKLLYRGYSIHDLAEKSNFQEVCYLLLYGALPNASAFAARVTASTLSDLHSSIVTAIGTLKGPLHGGAAESVMTMALEIGDPSKAHDYIRQKLDNHDRIMGFGHRVYRAEDPRARHMRDKSHDLGAKMGHEEWYQI